MAEVGTRYGRSSLYGIVGRTFYNGLGQYAWVFAQNIGLRIGGVAVLPGGSTAYRILKHTLFAKVRLLLTFVLEK